MSRGLSQIASHWALGNDVYMTILLDSLASKKHAKFVDYSFQYVHKGPISLFSVDARTVAKSFVWFSVHELFLYRFSHPFLFLGPILVSQSALLSSEFQSFRRSFLFKLDQKTRLSANS